MPPYIALNTELRKKAKKEFEKDLFKFTSSSVFGKTMENLWKRVNVSLYVGKMKHAARFPKPAL